MDNPETNAPEMARFKGYHSQIFFNERDYYPVRKMMAGVRKLAAVVGCTLGPKGRNVVVQRKVGARPRIINDGVSIAEQISLVNDLEEIGCQMVIEASKRTNADAGDGTTSAIVLSDALIQEGIMRVVAGNNAMQIYRGMEKTVVALTKYLEEEVAIQVTDDQIEDVATISASGNRVIGKFISRALHTVGRMGLITLEEGQQVEDTIETEMGMFIDECGYVSPRLINNADDGVIQYKDASVVVVDDEIETLEEIIPIMEAAFEKDAPIFIVAHAFSKDVVNFLALNKERSGLQVAAVNAPSFGELRSCILEDLAILTGATVIGKDTDFGIELKAATADTFGTANLIEVGKEGSLVQGPDTTKAAVDSRVEQLEQLRDQREDEGILPFEKDKINRRIAKLKGGVAVIYVGAMTELELRDRKLRYDDALCAIRSALEEGIVPGGATAYIKLADKVKDIIPTLKPEEQKGAEIIQSALEYPMKLVARNAGSHGPLVLSNVRKGQKQDSRYGWNAAEDKYGDMIEMGIIEPAKVIRCALENSVSVAKTFLLTESVVIQHWLGEKAKEADYGELRM